MVEVSEIFNVGSIVVPKEEKGLPYSMYLKVLESYYNKNGEPIFTAINYNGRYTFYVEREKHIGYHYCSEFRTLSSDEEIELMFWLEYIIADYPQKQLYEKENSILLKGREKMKKVFYLFFIILSLLFILSQIQYIMLKRKVNSITENVSNINSSVDKMHDGVLSLHMAYMNINNGYLIITPESKGYFDVCHTSVGPVSVTVKDIREYLNGYKVILQIGNLTSVVLSNLKLSVRWGEENKKDNEYTYPYSFYSGRSRNIEFIILPATPTDVKEISIWLHFKSMSMGGW